MFRFLSWLEAGLDRLRRRVRLSRDAARSVENEGDEAESCGEGCYVLGDGTAIPLGDLGVTPTAYRLRP